MSKERIAEIAAIIQSSPSTEARLMVEMMGLLVSHSRDKLVAAPTTDIMLAQGQARAYENVLKMLTVANPVRRTA